MTVKGTEKPISKVIIEYADGTSEKLDQYAAVGISGDTWHSIMLSPAGESAKIKMNNMLVELSNTLLEAIENEF
jgi:hypothetical protein